MTRTDYRARLADRLLQELMGEFPALMVTGPRAAGKTTTATRLARTAVRLDRAAEAAAFLADPDAALRGLPEPVLLDEWQEVPTVLGAVKRAVDADSRPGRFVLTGSVRAELDEATWPGTGRIIRVPMFGMTVRELDGAISRRPFLDRLADGELVELQRDAPDLRGYVDLALRGSFPDVALRSSERARATWLESYTEQITSRDVRALDPQRDPVRMRRFFESYAVNTAGIVADSTLFDAAGINRKTADAYEHRLTDVFLVDALPAWGSNRLGRLSARRKRYVVDPALVGSLLRVDEQAVMRDGDLLGRLLDTFVVSQLRPELALSRTRPRLFHLREEHGRHEIDIVAELGGGRIVALEVKASASPVRSDARHMTWLHERVGDRFVRGAVLHTGPRAFELAERIDAIPICALWG